jgi:hypothetical protein
MNTDAILFSVRAAVGHPVVCWLFGFKVVYLAVLLGAVWLWNGFDREKFHSVNARWPREGGPVFASRFATWDAAHYLYLSEVGYGKGAPSCAFYPLWPLLVRGVAPLVGGSHVLAGLVLANAFSLAAWEFFYCLVTRRWGESAAKGAVVFLVAFPGALFFQFNYTESLFLLLVMVLWLGLEQRRYTLACAAALLLTITRAVGLFVWAWVLGVMPAMSSTFTSFTRFASCAFPMFIALGEFLGRRQWRWLRWGLLAVFGVLHLALVWRFVNFRWAG